MPRARNAIVTFGNADYGRLGLGSKIRSIEIPTIITSLLDVVPTAVASAGAHTAVITNEGSLFTFGLNSHGQLGHSEGQLYVPEPAEVPLPEPATAVATGHYHTLCLTESNKLWAFGSNASGQLGVGKNFHQDTACEPRLVSSLRNSKIAAIAAGAEHSMAVTSGGELYTWGCGDNGRLGHSWPKELGIWGQSRVEWMPRLVRSLETQVVRSISAGHMHSSCVTDDSRGYLFGSNRYHQVGRDGLSDQEDAEIPLELLGAPGIQQISCGGQHSIASLSIGTVATWGANQNGCLGLGKKAGPSKVPSVVKELGNDAEYVSAGWKHSAAISSGGKLYTWGWGGSQGTALSFEEGGSGAGQLGLDNDFDYWQPARVKEVCTEGGERIREWKCLHVSCGLNHTAAVIQYY